MFSSIVHRMFTYERLSPISIMTKVTRKDDEIASNKERTNLFRVNDVLGNGYLHDNLQSDH